MSNTPALPLTSVKIDWIDALSDAPDYLNDLLDTYGSPLNLLNTVPFQANIEKVRTALSDLVNEHTIHYAIKANKAECFVKAAFESGIGADVASLPELRTAISCGIKGELITVTGVVKSPALVRAAIETGAILVVDHGEEIDTIFRVAHALKLQAKIAIRVSGFHDGEEVIASRFGILTEDLPGFVPALLKKLPEISLEGIHFHLPGYSSSARRGAIMECLSLVDSINSAGARIRFIDIGGGFPVRYLESESEWEAFWSAAMHYPIPGLTRSSSYPYFNETTIEGFLKEMLHGLRDEFEDRTLQLRCEPGRFLLGGSGATIAKVASVKPATHNRTAVTCEMNGTQLRPGRGELLVDPILVTSTRTANGEPPADSGYHLFGRYCSENDFLFRRPVPLNAPPVMGDVVLFPNTAGYHMHFLETHGHGFPLAGNLILTNQSSVELDASSKPLTAT